MTRKSNTLSVKDSEVVFLKLPLGNYATKAEQQP